MHQGRGSDQAILNGVRVGYLELRPTQRNCRIDRKDSPGKRRKDTILQPDSKRRSLFGVSSFHAKDADFQLMNGNDRDI